jgi:hypothetical protein
MLTPLPTLGILFENSQSGCYLFINCGNLLRKSPPLKKFQRNFSSGSDPARYDINLIKARDGLLQMVIHLNLISLITTAGNG